MKPSVCRPAEHINAAQVAAINTQEPTDSGAQGLLSQQIKLKVNWTFNWPSGLVPVYMLRSKIQLLAEVRLTLRCCVRRPSTHSADETACLSISEKLYEFDQISG